MRIGELSSDALARQFGPTELDVLNPGEDPRIITTSAKRTGQVLELSHVQFMPAGIQEFPDTHRAILQGMSMGMAFQAAGIEFDRGEQAAYHYALPANFERLFGVSGVATVVELRPLVGPNETPYAHILETFSPVVKRQADEAAPAESHLRIIRLLDDFLAARTAT